MPLGWRHGEARDQDEGVHSKTQKQEDSTRRLGETGLVHGPLGQNKHQQSKGTQLFLEPPHAIK